MSSDLQKYIKASQSLKQRFEILAENSTMSDFTFIVGPNKIEVPAHKFIFAVTSFEFYNLFVLSTPTDTNIYLGEIEYESFKEFIRYVYADEIQIGSVNFFDILTLSLRYEMDHLTDLCLKELPKLVEEEAFFGSFMELFNVWNKDKVSDVFLNIIGRRPLDFISEENVGKLTFEHLAVILKSPETETTEIDYFKLAMMWAEKQYNFVGVKERSLKNRSVLKNLFFHIRFPAMTINEFQECSSNYVGLFTNEELEKLLFHIRRKPEDIQIDFPSKKRCLVIKHKPVMETNRNKIMLANVSNLSELELVNSGVTCSRLDLFVDKSIIIHGIKILFHPNVMKLGDKELTINISIKGGGLTQPLWHICRMDKPTSFTGSSLEQMVRIEDQLRLPFSDHKYSIFIKISSNEGLFSSKEKFLHETPIRKLNALNGLGLLRYDITKGRGTSIANLLFSLEKIKLTIKRPQGNPIIVEVIPFETIGNIKKLIQKIERISTHEMILLYCDAQLDDNENIHSLGIDTNSFLYLCTLRYRDH